MLALKLVRLIERNSEALAQGLTEQIRKSERTSDFRKIAPTELQLAAAEVYRNLEEWLLQKTEEDIEGRFRAIGTRRAAEGIGLHQFVWALTISRDHLWRFLQRESFADTVLELHGEIELHQMLNQFFDLAVYYGIQGYGRARQPDRLETGVSARRESEHGIRINSPATRRETTKAPQSYLPPAVPLEG